MDKSELNLLVTKVQNGDRAAMSDLLTWINRPVYYQCYKMLANEQDAEDMTQEIAITVVQKIALLKEPGAFIGWLNTMVANRCVNAIKRGHKDEQFWEDEEGNSAVDFIEDIDEQTVPDKALDNAETVRMIAALVDELPPAQRLSVLMYYYDEMSVRDIAAALQVSENTVKSRLNYARRAIEKGVRGYEQTQGIKLYGASPLSFMLYFLQQDCENGGMTADAVRRLVENTIVVSAAAGSVVATGSAAAAGSATVAGGAAVGTKLLAGALVAVTLAGGSAVGYQAYQEQQIMQDQILWMNMQEQVQIQQQQQLIEQQMLQQQLIDQQIQQQIQQQQLIDQQIQQQQQQQIQQQMQQEQLQRQQQEQLQQQQQQEMQQQQMRQQLQQQQEMQQQQEIQQQLQQQQEMQQQIQQQQQMQQQMQMQMMF